MPDLPDWNVPVQTSGMVYRGTLVVAHTAPGPSENTLSFTLGTLDRACLVFVPAYDNSNIVTVVVARQGMPPLQTRNVQIRPAGEVVIAWLSPDVDPGWRVVMSVVGPVTETITAHVFTDTELPVVAVEAGLAPLLVEQNALAGPVSVNVTDRAARALGVVSGTGAFDVSDRAARLVGVATINPTGLLIANLGVTGGASNVAATGTILAAPGAGLRRRLWSLYVGPNDTAQAPTNWTFDVTDVPALVGFARVSGNGFLSGTLYWPGGFPFATNAAIGYQLVSTLAALSFGITLGYTTEAV